jgi:hypothetical protein
MDFIDRRRTRRVQPDRTPWLAVALLRPGQEVVLLDLSAGGARLESRARMNPGTRTELQLCGAERRNLRGHIGRCRVSRLDPVRYEGAFVFEERLDWSFALAG